MALHVPVQEVLSWPSPLIAEWMAYDGLDPLPDSWHQTGILAAIMSAAWGGKRTKPEEWIPRVRRARRQSEREQWAVFQSAAMAAEMHKYNGNHRLD